MKKRTESRRLWLWVGLGAFALHFLYGVGTTFSIANIGPWLLDWVDWLAASMPYFFFGALAGLLLQKKPLTDWAYTTLGFWLLADVAAFVFATPQSVKFALLFLFFPLIYGSFFTSFAWAILVPSSALVSGVKYALDVAYLAVFAGWLYLEIRHDSRRVWLRRVLLAVLFAVLLLGAVSCAMQLPPG